MKGSGLLVVLVAPVCLWAADDILYPDGVASGDVTSHSALLWTRVNQKASLKVEVSTDSRFRSAPIFEVRAKAQEDDDFTVTAAVHDLDHATLYYYRFRAGNQISPVGMFKTAALRNADQPVRFTWSSDTDGSFTPPLNHFEVLDRVREENADFFVYLGDTVYMDTNAPIATDLDAMRIKYRQVRGYAALRNLLAETSIYAIWDDHEIGDDFAGPSVNPALFHTGRQAFEEYLPVRKWSQRRGYFRTFRWGKHVELFILDQRSFRDAPAVVECAGDVAPTLPSAVRTQLGLPANPPAACLPTLFNPARTMLGAQQKQAFLSALQQSDATWKIIVNPVPLSLLFALPYDRWEGYAAEREEILGFIRLNGLRNVVAITGDLHATVAMDARSLTDQQPVLKEFISGPVAQWTLLRGLSELFGAPAAAGFIGLLKQIGQADYFNEDAYSYGLVEVDAVTRNLTVKLKDATGAVLHSKTLTPQ